MNALLRLVAILRKETLHILRDPRALGVTLLLPLIEVLLFSYVLTFDVNHIPTAVVDLDKTAQSRQYLSEFKSSTYFDLSSFARYSEVESALRSGVARIAIIVPPGFGRALDGGEQADVQLLVDGSDARVGSVAQSYARAITAQFSQALTLSAVAARGITVTRGSTPIAAESRVWYNPGLRSIDYIVPGIIGVIMAAITAVQIAGALVGEKERRTLENLLISPLQPLELALGKVIPYVGLAMVQSAAVVSVVIWGLGVPFRGSALVLVLSLLLFLATMLGVGLLVSALADTQANAQQLASMLAMLPTFMLSGFIYPISSMPPAVQAFTYLVPARYFLVILRGVFLKGASLSVLLPDVLALAGFAVATLGLSAFILGRRLG